MADGKLIFLRPASGSAKLVLGDAHAGSVIPDANLGIDAGFAGDAAADVHLAFGRPLAIDAGFAGEGAADVQLQWDANVSRGGLRHELCSHWQPAQALAAGLGSAWQQAQPLRLGTQARWQQADTQRGAVRGHWQEAERQRMAVAARWQQGELRRAGVDLLWQEAERLRAAALTRWQQAGPQRAAVRSHWQEMLRLRAAVAAHWQQGQARHAHLRTRYGDGQPVRLPLRPHWQEAWRPRSGVSQLPKPPEPRPPCYDPARLGLLVLDAPYTGDGRLVFVCHRAGPGPDPEPPQYVIPLLEVYVSLHTLNAVLLPSLEPVALLDATIESDDGGFGWALSANGPEHLLDQLAPVSGLPARVRVTIDGIDWVFAVERISRTRRFGQHRAAIQGRSITALLGDPYMPQQSWLNTGNLTAEQIVAQALEFTGTTIAWGIDDWLVPAGAWSFTGTPLQAALRVAESVGAVVRSHRTDAQLIYAPRYPALPWAWGSAMANVQMPAAIITTDSLEPDPRPAYNAVYVGGMAQGVLGQVRRVGTAGDLLAPQVTDALITQEVAARQRGSAVLGGAGNKLTHTMTLPLLTGGTNPGLIQPGYLIEVNDIGHTWRGLVRGIRVTAGMPTVRQTITVERNA
ncbi:hypothetical protein [Diaphorobacter sp.]|uniref:hypothetical protein n=1 Tax=Diaphorobacter sp. TaxID=1934310 RepID=UPI00258ED97F|nr:hypothetical protein [Diaphorobacter sp.]